MPTRNTITAPDPRFLDPSSLEQIYAGQLTNPRDSAYAGGMLLMEQMERKRAGADYLQRLGGVNDMQRMLALRGLDDDMTKHRETTGAALYKEGADLSNIAPLRNYIGNRGIAESGDIIRRQGALANALKNTGEGLNQASQAGVNLNPGQISDMSPGSLARLISTTGEPRSITEETLKNGPKVEVTLPTVNGTGGTATITAKGSSPAQTVKLADEARIAHGGSSMPTATDLQNKGVSTAEQVASQHGAKIVSKKQQGNNIVVEFDRPVPAQNGNRSYRSILVGPDGKLAAHQ